MTAKEAVQRNSAIWFTDIKHLNDGDMIICKIGDVFLEGVVSLARKRLSVEMIVPYGGSAKSQTIDEREPLMFTETCEKGSVANEFGSYCAQNLLMDIFFEKKSSECESK